ncbi:MAG: rod shape-determining protein [Algoriphagus sp.]|nr:rod shape-determining protein [Algoriphagus sp.]
MKFFSNGVMEIGIDLGTANTMIIHNGKIVVDEPSIIAYEVSSNKVIAVGKEARQMHEKTHANLKTIRPLKDGVIADFTAAELMIKNMVKLIPRTNSFLSRSYKMTICIPTSITEVERRAVKDSAVHAGAVEVFTIYEPLAAALGIGLDIEAPDGFLIVDIGGGTSEIALIALSGIVTENSIRIAGDAFNMDILNYIRKNYNIMIGERTAEQIKLKIGSAITHLEEDLEEMEVAGRDLLTGIPKSVKLNYSEIAFALDKSLIKIEEAILKALENTPPELSSDLFRNGIYLTGGGALLRGIDRRISDKTKLKVTIGSEPLGAVVRGTAVAMSNYKKYAKILSNN